MLLSVMIYWFYGLPGSEQAFSSHYTDSGRPWHNPAVPAARLASHARSNSLEMSGSAHMYLYQVFQFVI